MSNPLQGEASPMDSGCGPKHIGLVQRIGTGLPTLAVSLLPIRCDFLMSEKVLAEVLVTSLHPLFGE